MMLTEERLKSMNPGEVFASGVIPNSPEGIFMTRSRMGENLRWLAKRGNGFHDWAIYCEWEGTPDSYVLSNGQKVCDMNNVKKLVQSDETAIKLYRL